MSIRTIDPATEQVVATYEAMDGSAIEEVLDSSARAFRSWRCTGFDERADALRAVADQLRRGRDRYAALITTEMGKPITQARAEIDKCAWVCDHYAYNGAELLAQHAVASSASESFVQFLPLGSVLAVMPWNFPFWQVFRALAPIVMGGNTVVLKHASNVTGCALELERLMTDAGLPEGILGTLVVPGSAVAGIVADRRIRGVTLTGSEAAGRSVAAAAGNALIPVVLELGGSDPFVVLDDADIEAAAAAAATARFQNAGQSCIAAKRFIVVDAVAEQFEERLTSRAQSLRVGDPTRDETEMGPLARADLVDDLHAQVQRSVEMGAQVRVGGAARRPGWYYEPTVVTGVTADMPVAREETFGPVAAVIRVRDRAEALCVANDSDFGLGAALWTGDANVGRSLAGSIESGAVFVNGMTASDPRLPFGGVKNSGYGRELGEFGIREFVNVQTVWVGPAR